MDSHDDKTDDLDIISIKWQEKHLLEEPTSLIVIGRLLRLSKSLTTLFQFYHEQFGLRQGEFDVLAALYRSEGNYSLTPSQLHQSLLISSGTMTSRLQHLEQKKFLKRRHCNDDRRCVNVSLTAKGQQLVEKILPDYFKLLTNSTSGISSQQKNNWPIC